MDYINILGFVAGIITTAAYVPQVIKTARTKSAKDLSLAWLVASAVGLGMWEIYGLVTMSYPLIAANLVSISLVLYLVKLHMKHG